MSLTNPESADHIAQEAGSFEPQRQNNFSFEASLGAADKDLIVLALHGLTLPNESNEEMEIPYQNEKVYVAGGATFEGLTLTVKDFVDQDVRGALLRWRALVYDPVTGKVGKAKDYKKKASIIMAGPDGDDVRVCQLKGTWPQALNGGTLDHSAQGEQVLIEVTLRFDKPLWNLPGLT